jgi:hypothetical protein
MIELLSANNPTIFMIVSYSLLIWISLVVACLALLVFIVLMLLKYSKNPDKWMHDVSPEEESYPGLMRELSDTIKSDKKLNEYSFSIKNTMQMMFFQKIENTKDISTNDLIDIKKNNSQQLYDVIKNDDLANWIVSLKDKKSDRTKRLIKVNKQKYVKEINTVLEKMEAWGE